MLEVVLFVIKKSKKNPDDVVTNNAMAFTGIGFGCFLAGLLGTYPIAIPICTYKICFITKKRLLNFFA